MPRYSITAGTSDRPIALADGKLTTSTVQKHDFVKYSFYVDQMESDVDVVITPQALEQVGSEISKIAKTSDTIRTRKRRVESLDGHSIFWPWLRRS